jgi:hypothetical protein
LRQGESGLGLAGQREANRRFAEALGYEITAEFCEVETGKGSDAIECRPQLTAALKAANARGQVLGNAELAGMSTRAAAELDPTRYCHTTRPQVVCYGSVAGALAAGCVMDKRGVSKTNK